MPSSAHLTKTVAARVPYLNCAPFFHRLAADETVEWVDVPPRTFGEEAQAGRMTAGPMALADFLRLRDSFERIANLGIAVRGRCGSALLLSSLPVRQLQDATIAVSEETSTTAVLLRLILEVRYEITPKAYRRGTGGDAEAVLLIGDEALKSRLADRRYPYEVDLAFEWWLWQHLPMVFAVWAVRKDCPPSDKQRLSRLLQQQLAVNLGRLDEVARGRAEALALPADDLKTYLEGFAYRFGPEEERAIQQFERLVHAYHLL